MSCPQEQPSEGSECQLLVPSGENYRTIEFDTCKVNVLVMAQDKQQAYQTARKLRREQWAISDAEDFCARKEVEPGTYKPLWWNEKE